MLTGMSGVGKSTILEELNKLGYKTIDCDQDGYIYFDENESDHLLNIEKLTPIVKSSLDTHLFVSVTAVNQTDIYKYIDIIILLEAPLDVMKNRISQRRNAYGKSEDEWQKIVKDTDYALPLLKRSSDVVISTDKPLNDVLDEIVRLLH